MSWAWMPKRAPVKRQLRWQQQQLQPVRALVQPKANPLSWQHRTRPLWLVRRQILRRDRPAPRP